MGEPKKIDPELREIGLRIAMHREACGWSQKELSIQAGITWQTLSEIENGKREFKVPVLLRIADALRVPLSALQSEALDRYGGIPNDLLPLIEQIEGLPPDLRKMMVPMFCSQIDSLPKNITPT